MGRIEDYEDKRLPQDDGPDPDPQEFYYKISVPNPKGYSPVKMTVTARADHMGRYEIAGLESEDKSYQPKFEDLPESYQDDIAHMAEKDAWAYRKECEAYLE